MTATVHPPVRIADVVDGHVHPALACTADGDLLAVYNRQGGAGKALLACRSGDGGSTWSAPQRLAAIADDAIYPGSLTTLRDGRLLLNWSCYRDPQGTPWREPRFCLSDDSGRTWSAPRTYPVADPSNYTCMRHPVVELSPSAWVCPFYDRTVVYDAAADAMRPFGDGRNHGMVPLVRTAADTWISGAPQAAAPVPVGPPGDEVGGLRSTDGGRTWQALHAFPYFGVAGYDLTVLRDGRVVLTAIVYGVGVDGEYRYDLIVSRDDGRTWGAHAPVVVFDPGRRIGGRGWPRTVQLDAQTLGTLFYDLAPDQASGPGLWLVRTELGS